MRPIKTLLVLLPLLQASAPAAVIFSDTFDRPDSRNVQASLTGITDNTGSGLTTGNVYSFPHLDPNSQAPTYGVQDGVAANGGGVQILSNQLQLAVGAGTANAVIGHNFTDSSILSAGGFSVTVGVIGYSSSGDSGFGAALALGMSQTEAASAGDSFDGTPRMTGAFGNLIGSTVPVQTTSDFWVALRGNNSLVWGSNTGTVQGISGLAGKTGTVSVNFSLSSFSAGSTVNYEIFLNSVSEGTGSFVWSGTNENFIGLDARDPVGVTFDNLSVNTIPEPAAGLLAFVGLAGLLRRRR